MGNRAVITFNTADTSPCIYLHWNGGRASVEAFLEAARLLGLRHCPRAGYQAERAVIEDLAGMIARHFFGCEVGMNVYVEHYGRADTDNGDNGVYVLGTDLSIVGRKFVRHGEEIDTAKTAAIVEQIVARAPVFND